MISANKKNTYVLLITMLLLIVSGVLKASTDPNRIRSEFRALLEENKRKQARGDFRNNQFIFSFTEEGPYRETYKNGGGPIIEPGSVEAVALRDRLVEFNTNNTEGVAFFFFTGSIFLDADRSRPNTNVSWEELKSDFYLQERPDQESRYETLDQTKAELLASTINGLLLEAQSAGNQKVIVQFAIRSAIGYKRGASIEYYFNTDFGISTSGFEPTKKFEIENSGKRFYSSGGRSILESVNSVMSSFGNFRLLNDYEQLVENTANARVQNQGADIAAFAELIKQRKASDFLIYESSKISIDGDDWKIKGIVKKLELLAEETDFRYYVALMPVNYVIPKGDCDQFARSVFQQAELGPQDILLAVPLYRTSGVNLTTSRFEDFDLKMYGFHGDNTAIVDVRPVVNFSTSLYDNFLTVYKRIYKPSVNFYAYINYNGEVSSSEGKRKNRVAGNAEIYHFELSVDARIEVYKNLLLELEGAKRRYLDDFPESSPPDPAYTEDELSTLRELHFADIERQEAKLLRFEEDNPFAGVMLVSHGLWETSLKETDPANNGVSRIATQFATWYSYNEFGSYSRSLLTVRSPDDSHFILGRNIVTYEATLNAIDALSVVLAPFELDGLAEIGGALYAGYYQDWPTAAVYAAGVAIPSTFALRKLLLGRKLLSVKYVGNLSIKKADFVYSTIVPFIPFRIRTYLPWNVVADLTSAEASALLGKLRSMRMGDDAWKALSKDVASADFLNAIKANPELVDAWKYFKNGNVPDQIRTNPEWLGKLSDDLSNSKYKLKELFDESPGDIGIWKNLKDDPYHYRQLLEEGSLTDERWIKWSQREFFVEVTKAGKQFENVVSNSFSSISQFKRFLDDGYKHLKQIYLKGGNTIIADDILIKADVDEFGDDIYKAVINDSKLSSGSPWTINQSDELIKKFRDNPSIEYLDFDVRTDNSLLTSQGAPVGFTQGTKVRIYRNEVFKTISDGNNGIAEVIKMADVNFR